MNLDVLFAKQAPCDRVAPKKGAGKLASSSHATIFAGGEVAEWFKAHAWTACLPKGIEGSNPFLSASHSCRFRASEIATLVGKGLSRILVD